MSEAPLSWRDVYKATNESKAEVLEAIFELKKDIAKVTDDHEDRIRLLERSDISDMGHAKGVRRVISVERAGLATLIALGSAGLALASFILR